MIQMPLPQRGVDFEMEIRGVEERNSHSIDYYMNRISSFLFNANAMNSSPI